jgi:hypothetical protein
VSFILTSKKLREDDTRAFRGYFTLLLMIVAEIFNRCHHVEDSDVMDTDNNAMMMGALYDNVCLLLVSRLISVSFLRQLLRSFLPELPVVPNTVLKLLRLLVFTGNRNTPAGFINASITGMPTGGEKEKLKSVKFESMHLLMMLSCQHNHAASAGAALDTLLWCALADDFEIRSKAISYLISDVIRTSTWARDRTIQFAVHALASILGPEAILAVLTAKTKLEPDASSDGAHLAIQQGDHDSSMDVTNAEGVEGEEDVADAVMGEESEEIVDLPEELCSLYVIAKEEYDGGKLFEGAFTLCPTGPTNRVEVHCRRHTHLLSQLCVVHGLSRLARVYFDASIVASSDVVRAMNSSGSSMVDARDGAAVDGNEDVAVVAVPDAKPGSKDETQLDVLCRLLRADVSTIIPAIVASVEPHLAFTFIDDISCDTAVMYNLMEQTLSLLQQDMQMPASGAMIMAVDDYIRRNAAFLSDPEDKLELFDSTAPLDTAGNSMWVRDGVDLRQGRAVRLMIPIISGLSGAEVEALLPFIIRAVGHSLETVKHAFDRIIKARPPPLTRAVLLTTIHRYFTDVIR